MTTGEKSLSVDTGIDVIEALDCDINEPTPTAAPAFKKSRLFIASSREM
jgi:hypothetical protein